MSFRPDEKPLMTTGPFQGLDASNDPFYIDPKFALSAQNFYPNTAFQGFSVAQGRSFFTNGNLPAAAIGGQIFKFFTSPTTWAYLIYASNGQQYRFTSLSGYTAVGAVGTGSPPSAKWVSAQNWAFFSNGIDVPVKIDTSFNVTNWGIVAPASAPTATPTTGGNLTPGSAYAYLLTYDNAVQESTAGPATAFITPTITPSTGTMTYAGGPAAGCIVGIDIYLSGLITTQASYELTAADTLNSALASLTANFNGVQQPGNITASLSGLVITLSNPTGINGPAYEYAGFVANAGAGTLSVVPLVTPTNFAGGVVNNAFSLTGIPVSGDAQVTTVNIYRIGGTQSQFQLVGSVANGTTTYTDTLADNAITGQNLVQFRDPPKPFQDIVYYQDRIWGLGYTSSNPYTTCDVWYTNFQEPWGFNSADQVLPCNENIGVDPIVGGAALPMMLLVFKRQSTWGIFGTSPSDYVPLPLFPLGCASKYTIASGYGLVFWLSPDGIVYTFDGTSPQNISDITQTSSSVKSILDNMTISDFSLAVGFVADRAYYISFPTRGFTLGYSLLTQSWFQLSFVAGAVSYDPANNDEIIATYVPGLTNISQWFTGTTDFGNPITAFYTTGFSDGDSPAVTKVYRHAVLYSSSSVTGNVILTINVLGSMGTATFTTPVSISGNETTVSLPPTLQGQQAQITVTVVSSTGTLIDQIILYGYEKRMLSETG